MIRARPFIILLSIASNASAGSVTNVPRAVDTANGMLQSFLGLTIVIATIVGLAWLGRKLRGPISGQSQRIKMVAQLAVGAKECVSLIELADTWILVGITQTQISTLHTMPKESQIDDSSATHPQSFAKLFDKFRSYNRNV
jgi:flagellar protein FliO/FliZ